MAKVYTHEDFIYWSTEETPGWCMFSSRWSLDPCNEPAAVVTDVLRFRDGCKMMIWACADEKHQPQNVELQSAK